MFSRDVMWSLEVHRSFRLLFWHFHITLGFWWNLQDRQKWIHTDRRKIQQNSWVVQKIKTNDPLSWQVEAGNASQNESTVWVRLAKIILFGMISKNYFALKKPKAPQVLRISDVEFLGSNPHQKFIIEIIYFEIPSPEVHNWNYLFWNPSIISSHL